MILAQLAHFASHTVNTLALFQEEQTVSFSPMGLWNHMGWLARCVAIILFIESIWSLAVMIDRYLYFSAARKQSREFAPKVAGALKDSKLEEAITAAGTRTKAVLEDGCWVLNGAKTFTTNAHNADVCVAMAVTDRAAAQQASAGALEGARQAEDEGVRVCRVAVLAHQYALDVGR